MSLVPTSLTSKLSSSAKKKLSSAAKKVATTKQPARNPAISGASSYNQLLGVAATNAPTPAKKPVSTAAPAKSSGSSSSSSKNSSGYTYRAPSTSSSRSSSGGGGGGGGGGGAIGPVGWNPTGLAANYLESAADLFAQDPAILLRDLTTQRYGADGGQTIFSQLAPTIGNANALYLAMQGQDAGQGTNDEWINWLGSFIDQQLTPGQFFDYQTAVNNIFGAAEGSPLRAFLSTGDAVEQAENFNKILGAVLRTSYHPLFAEAINRDMRNRQLDYQVAASKAAVDPFIAYLQATNPNLNRTLGV